MFYCFYLNVFVATSVLLFEVVLLQILEYLQPLRTIVICLKIVSVHAKTS